MIGINQQHRALYSGVALLSLGVVAVATGGGLFGSETWWYSDWQHRVFRMLCHQDPARSFWMNGTPMAVCTRCYGIYVGFAFLWVSMPAFGWVVQKISFANKLLLSVVLLNLADVVGNVLGFWQNTHVSRFILGNLIGLCAVLVLAGDFLTNKLQLKRDAYGFDGPTEFRT